MPQISSVSTKALVISLIGAFSVLALGLALLTSYKFKQAAFESKQKMSSQFIRVTADEAFSDLNDLLSELGTELRSDKDLRKKFKNITKGNAPSSELESNLNEPFNRRFHTAGLINLKKIRAYDSKLNHLTNSTQGESFGSGLDQELRRLASARKGADRLKMLSHLWSKGNTPYYSQLIPVGGLRVTGYLEVIVEPAHNLKIIESSLDAPIKITGSTGEHQHQSDSWPNETSNFVLAKYNFEGSNGKSILGVEAAFDNSNMISEINAIRSFVMGTFLIATFLFVFFATSFLNKTLFKPVQGIVDEMHEAASGNLLVEIDNFGIKEVHTLSNTLEEFVDSLKGNVRLILDNSANLCDLATRLSDSSEQNKTGIDRQQQQTEQVATAMNEMNATVAEVARNTASAAETANNSQEKSLLGKEAVDHVIHTVNNLSETIQKSESLIEKLNEESNAIGSILDVITSISEQTNLLALNAAIEAARAGEAGRGFAVVADEVRTLATKTQESASDIRNMVESLQDGTRDAVESMNISRTTADQAVDEINVAGQAIDEVSAAVGLLSDINTQIATAAEEQAAVVEDINKSVVSIRDVGIDNTEIASRTAEDGVNMLQVAELLRQSVQKFKI